LGPDRHVIESADHTFQGFLSTQQQCLPLAQEHSAQKSKVAEEMLICETKDFVEIGIKADVFYRISISERVLLIVGKVIFPRFFFSIFQDNVPNLVKETAIATLNSIIRSTSLADIAQNKDIMGNVT
jgi:hypothetical protein